MGIKGFQTYVEVFFGKSCLKGFTIENACHNIKDFSLHEIFGLGLALMNNENNGDNDNMYERCGVYIDLGSFMYGRMLKSLEGTRQYKKLLVSLESAVEMKTVVCELDSETIDKIVNECKDMLVENLMPLFLKAYSIYFAYDNFSPLAKCFEQHRRKKQSRFLLSSNSREACFSNIVKAVRDSVRQAHIETWRKHINTIGLTDLIDSPLIEMVVDFAINSQFSSHTTPFRADAPFTVGEGEWKCLYRIRDDIAKGMVDRCYVFGHDWDIGFAMTIYQPNFWFMVRDIENHGGQQARLTPPQAIQYVYGPTDRFQHNKPFDEKERMLHFICLSMFGNDYVCGLVHLSKTNAVLMKSEFENMYKGDVGFATSRQVEELSRLFRNEDLTKLEEYEDDATKRRRLSIAFATVVARMLAAVYGNKSNTNLLPDKIDNVLHYADMDAWGQVKEPNECTLKLRQHLSQQRKNNEECEKNIDQGVANKPSTSKGVKGKCNSDESTLLTCKDSQNNKVSRTFQQCMDTFALTMLWYLSYSMFYFRSPTGRKKMWMAQNNEDVPMYVGLSMGQKNTFRYNDTRLAKRYDIHRLLELKEVLQTMNICNLYWVIEGAFDNALNKK